MTREEILAKLNQMRADVRQIRDHVDSPAICNCMREMEVALHLARGYLGEIGSICPETE